MDEMSLQSVRMMRQAWINLRHEAECAYAHSRDVRGYVFPLTILEEAWLAVSVECTRYIRWADTILGRRVS